MCELDADVECPDKLLAELDIEIAYYKHLNGELSVRSGAPVEELMRLQRGQELAEETIRYLHEENQRAASECQTTIEMKEAEVQRLALQLEQQERAHCERLAAEAAL
jgi:hypothetical protein